MVQCVGRGGCQAASRTVRVWKQLLKNFDEAKFYTIIKILYHVCQNVVQVECVRGLQWPIITTSRLPPCGTWVMVLPDLTSDLPHSYLVFPVFCISSCHTNLSSFFFFHSYSLLYIYIFFVYRVVLSFKCKCGNRILILTIKWSAMEVYCFLESWKKAWWHWSQGQIQDRSQRGHGSPPKVNRGGCKVFFCPPPKVMKLSRLRVD